MVSRRDPEVAPLTRRPVSPGATTLQPLHTVPKLTPEITTGMGSSPVIGYGKYHYKSASGREGDWFLIGLTAGKNYFSLHICAGDKGGYLVEQNAAKLGRVTTGRSCINFKNSRT